MTMVAEEVFPGVVIDRDTKTFEVDRVRLPVGILMRSPYSPPRTPAKKRADTPQNIIDMIEADNPGYFDRPSPPYPEAIHVNILTETNPWWVEVTIYPGDPTFPPGLTINFPSKKHDPNDWESRNILQAWRWACERRDSPVLGENEDVFGGCEPGTWIWDE